MSQREHSRVELRRKLQRAVAAQRRRDQANAASAESAEQIDALLDTLEAKGYLSDQRFVESRVRVRAVRFGSRRIAQELKQHGLAMTSEIASELARSDLARAANIWRRRFGQVVADKLDAKERARQIRFLIARGFSAEVAHRAQKQGAQGDDDRDIDASD